MGKGRFGTLPKSNERIQMSNTANSSRPATQDAISKYAYSLWESEGRPPGRDLEYWLQAEAHLNDYQQYDSAPAPKKPAPAAAQPDLSESPKPNTRTQAVAPARKRAVAVQRASVPPTAQPVLS